jgi:hypothetical protein
VLQRAADVDPLVTATDFVERLSQILSFNTLDDLGSA